jgi:monofunctional biosynthetic peptidoglycan transglycosylase
LTTVARWRGREVGYWADFGTRDGEWQTVDIPFSNFIPRFRGYQLDGPPLDTGVITGMGLMIYDKRDGPFELTLAGVYAYPAEALPFQE